MPCGCILNNEKWRLEEVSKSPLGFKVKAECGDQPQEYIEYFED
jgi:hypothetical protein